MHDRLPPAGIRLLPGGLPFRRRLVCVHRFADRSRRTPPRTAPVLRYIFSFRLITSRFRATGATTAPRTPRRGRAQRRAPTARANGFPDETGGPAIASDGAIGMRFAAPAPHRARYGRIQACRRNGACNRRFRHFHYAKRASGELAAAPPNVSGMKHAPASGRPNGHAHRPARPDSSGQTPASSRADRPIRPGQNPPVEHLARTAPNLQFHNTERDIVRNLKFPSKYKRLTLFKIVTTRNILRSHPFLVPMRGCLRASITVRP